MSSRDVHAHIVCHTAMLFGPPRTGTALLWASRISIVIHFTCDTLFKDLSVHAHIAHVQVIWYIYNFCHELPEQCTLQCRCEMVPQHFLRRKMFDHYVPSFYPILYEIVAHIDMFCVFGAGFFPVLF